MELAPRYCRTCGSRILVKHICHNCNNEPLKGDNYCYDCGALTPNANSCLNCGAKYNSSFAVKPLLIIGSLLLIAILAGSYVFFKYNENKNSDPTQKESVTPHEVIASREISVAQKPIINNPVDTLKTPLITIDTSKKKVIAKPDTIVIKKIQADTVLVKKTEPAVFTSEELKSYNRKCSYFEKGSKNKIVFFISGGAGFIKISDKVYELKRKRKSVDAAAFASGEWEADIAINGLSGTAKEWLASCTLIIKNTIQKTSVKHKVYSSCIEL